MKLIRTPSDLKLTSAQARLVERHNEIVTVTEGGNRAKIKKLVQLTARENTLLAKVEATIKQHNEDKKAAKAKAAAVTVSDKGKASRGGKKSVEQSGAGASGTVARGTVTLVGQSLQHMKGVLVNVTPEGIEVAVKAKRQVVTAMYPMHALLGYTGAGVGEEVSFKVFTHASTVYEGQLSQEDNLVTVVEDNGETHVFNAYNSAGIEVQVVLTGAAVAAAGDDDEDEDLDEDEDEVLDEDEDEDLDDDEDEDEDLDEDEDEDEDLDDDEDYDDED